MYVYHSHFNSAEQVGAGLYGALIVAPKTDWRVRLRSGARTSSRRCSSATAQLGFTLNGKGFPSTMPIVAKRGDWVLIHMVERGRAPAPDAPPRVPLPGRGQDGFPLSLANRYMADTLVVAPGAALRHARPRGRPGSGRSTATSSTTSKARGHVRHGDRIDRRIGGFSPVSEAWGAVTRVAISLTRRRGLLGRVRRGSSGRRLSRARGEPVLSRP